VASATGRAGACNPGGTDREHASHVAGKEGRKRQLSANVLKELHENVKYVLKSYLLTLSFQTFKVDWIVIAYKQNAYVLQSNLWNYDINSEDPLIRN
jgi:hypothetical protein